MKKALLFAAAAILGLSANARTVFTEQDRSNWVVTGDCQHGEAGEGKDGGLAQLMDGNLKTFWHSEYQNGHNVDCPHYFIVNRGENAGSISGFGYMPRTGSASGNGYVTSYKLYVTDDVTSIVTAATSANQNAGNITDGKASINDFMAANTATKEGTFNILQNQTATHTLQQVAFDAAVQGQYVVFVITGTSSNAGDNKHANCAEFYLYDTHEATAEEYKAEIENAVAAGNCLVAANVEGEAATAWAAAVAANNCEPYTEEKENAIIEAYYALAEAETADLLSGRSFVFFNVQHEDMLSANDNKEIKHLADGNEWAAVFTLKPASEGKVYLYNEFTRTYIKNSGALYRPASLVADVANATEYTINLISGGTATICYAGFSDATNNCLHADGIGNNRIVSWAATSNASQWNYVLVDDMYAAQAYLEGAYANLPAVGTALGQYHYADEAAAEATLAAAEAALKGEDATAVRTAADAVSQIAFEFNQLAPGFYRFSGSDKYLTSTPAESDANRIMMSEGVGDGNNGAETVVYVDENNRVVSLNNGLVMGKFAAADDRKFVLASSNLAGAIKIFPSTEAGKYKISFNDGGHFIYHAGTNGIVDRGNSGASGAGYNWTIEPAAWIPIPVGDADHVTLYSPVALEDPQGRFELYTLSTNGEHAEIVKAPVEEGGIAANTVYYAKVNKAGVDATTKCSFLKVNETAAQTETAADPAINGSIYATEKAEGTSYYTIGVKDEAAHFLAHEGDYIPGFTAHIATATPSDAVNTLGGYKLVAENEKTTTSISEIVAEGAASNGAVFDLQGRRVSKASKGIFIINGKKTLVK